MLFQHQLYEYVTDLFKKPKKKNQLRMNSEMLAHVCRSSIPWMRWWPPEVITAVKLKKEHCSDFVCLPDSRDSWQVLTSQAECSSGSSWSKNLGVREVPCLIFVLTLLLLAL